MKGRNKFNIILVLGLLTAIGPFSIDMYLPGFPSIATALHTSIANVTRSLSSFFIGISLGQLLYGPLLDRYGRKPPVYFGMAIYLIASIACAFSSSVNTLILLRLIQALGGCAGMVAARAMVRDIFPVEENAKVFSLLMLVVAVSPIIAPTLGGYVTSAYGWQAIFIILSLIAAITLITLHFNLPESRKPDPSISFLPAPIVKSFLIVFKVPQFYTYAFTGAIAAAGLYAYISGSPHLFMQIYSVTEKQYGWIFAIIAMGLIISSQINSIALRKYKSEQIIRVALLCQSFTGLVILLGNYYNLLNLFSTITLICIFLSCQGFTFPNSSALSMAPFTKNAGTASALMGAIQLALGACSSALVSYFTNKSAVPMSAVMFGCSFLSLTILSIGRRVITSNASELLAKEGSAEMMSTS
ncbi:MAG: multidrug effflux MFS transporter [Ginsengibacter sp.]